MVDTWLANQLLSNIATDAKLLIVGDADRKLPSNLSVGSWLISADPKHPSDQTRTYFPSN